MDAPSLGSSMYASTNYGRSTSPNIVNGNHYRSPSALSDGASGQQTLSHIGHYRAESVSTPMGFVQEEDPLLGPFSDANRVPTPLSVMPLVHEDGGSVRNFDLGGGSRAHVPPPYDGVP